MSKCNHSFTDDGVSLLICTECGFEIDARFDHSILEQAAQECFEAGGNDDGSYTLESDELDIIITNAIHAAIIAREAAK